MTESTFTRLLLLRHGETSRPDLFHGCESDIDLGERGRAQATGAGQWLRGQQASALYCSDLLRARQTAEHIGRATNLTPVIEPALHERRMGRLSGQDRLAHWHVYEETRARWMAGELTATHPGAESYQQILDRIRPALARIGEAHQGSTAIVVAHGVVIRVFLTAMVAGMTVADWDKIGIDCAAVNELIWDGSTWRALNLNQDVSGLGSGSGPGVSQLPGGW